MKIVMMGRNDPAGMMITFANAINRYTEHSARVIALETRYEMEYEYDILIPRIQEDDFGEVEELLRSADIFHFHMIFDENNRLGPLVIRDYLQGKALLHHHHGHPEFVVNAESFRERYRRLGRRVIVSTPDLLKLLPEATWQPNMVPIHEADFLPRADLSRHLSSQSPLRIVQAPTLTWYKHTAEFKRVTRELAKEYTSVECEIVQSVSYRECLKRKRNAQIVFDHMNGWFGISSLESLSHGVPTVGGLDAWNTRHILEFTGSESHPWIVAHDERELREALIHLIENPAERVEAGVRSRAFMEQHWDEERALGILLRIYDRLG